MRAVVFALMPNGTTTTDVIEGPECLARARALRESVKDDFPNALFAVASDQEAKDDLTESILAQLRKPSLSTTEGDDAGE